MSDSTAAPKSTAFTKQLGIEYPLICGAMYPCSNPELVAAVSNAGGIGIVQPLSLIYVYGYKFRDGLKYIKSLTSKPFGMNVLTEESSKIYQERMRQWVDIALEEGCRFFITALGNPRWIVNRAKPQGSLIYHDVTEVKWAEKAISVGVDGLICVNNRAGGHAGTQSPEKLFADLQRFNKPLICAGGVGNEDDFKTMLNIGYAGVQLGTRFIATSECKSHESYKNAIVNARAKDIVLTEKITGVPVSVILTPAVERAGLKAGFLAKWILMHPKLKHWMRLFYSVKSIWTLKRSSLKGLSHKDFWQAGKSVDHIHNIESAAAITQRFGDAWKSIPTQSPK